MYKNKIKIKSIARRDLSDHLSEKKSPLLNWYAFFFQLFQITEPTIYTYICMYACMQLFIYLFIFIFLPKLPESS